MTPQTLLAEAARRGIDLYPDGHSIRYRGPRTAVADLKPKLAANKDELLTLLRAESREAEIDRLARADGWTPMPPAGHPAYSILEICQRAGVALRIDPVTGDLVIGKAGAKAEEPTQPWCSLLHPLEAHLDAVAALVESGWKMSAKWPDRRAKQ